MRDPFSWSFPIGRLFGITIKVHLLFPLVAIGMIVRISTLEGAAPGIWVDVAMVVGLLFFSVLLHEFGHCFAARRVGGDATEVLMWPLGGLAACETPHNPRAHFIVAAGGPLVNVALCLGSALALAFCFDRAWQPLWNPFAPTIFINAPGYLELTSWDGLSSTTNQIALVTVARFFWVNWALLLLNVVLIGFPFDGGRMFQAALWPYFGYRSAMRYAVVAGFITMFVLILVGVAKNEVMLLLLAWFTYTSCSQEWIKLETGGEDSLFGYDFSQGYTSLERDLDEPDQSVTAAPPQPRPKKLSFWQRWLQRRAERKRQREMEEQVAEESRMDQLLDKIQREGKHTLTEEEQRFLKRVSERYKNRH
jgi:stage IV sporulation protein FB